jgi:hypothetical protein
MSLKRRRYTGTFRGARQGALLELIATLLLAMVGSINNLFKCTDMLEVVENTHLLKKVHSLLKTWVLAFVLKSKRAIALNVQFKRLLQQSERSW